MIADAGLVVILALPPPETGAAPLLDHRDAGEACRPAFGRGAVEAGGDVLLQCPLLHRQRQRLFHRRFGKIDADIRAVGDLEDDHRVTRRPAIYSGEEQPALPVDPETTDWDVPGSESRNRELPDNPRVPPIGVDGRGDSSAEP